MYASCLTYFQVMCVQLHGDSSVTGQGVVMETLELSMFFLFCMNEPESFLACLQYIDVFEQVISRIIQAEELCISLSSTFGSHVSASRL